MRLDIFAREVEGHYDNLQQPTRFTDPSFDPDTQGNTPPGMTTPFIGHLLNFAVSLLEAGEAHLHVGVWKGKSLVYAIRDNLDKIHYACDNFVNPPADAGIRDEFYRWMQDHGFMSRLHFYEEDVFQLLQASPRKIRHPIGVFFYDGLHTYEAQLEALRLIKPYLADRSLIVVDDTNYDQVRRANLQWLGETDSASLLFDLPYVPSWWNGVHVIAFERHA